MAIWNASYHSGYNVSYQNTSISCAEAVGLEYKCDIIIGIRRGIACLSLIGCCLVIGMIWLFRKYKEFSQRLILYLTIAAVLNALVYIMNDWHDGPYCIFLGWGATFTMWAVLTWVCCITCNLFMCAVRGTSLEKREWVCHIVCWCVPLILSLLPLISDKYGPSGYWCWVKHDWGWRFGIWYFPLFILIVLLFVTYTYIFITVQKKLKTYEGHYDPAKEQERQTLREDVRPLKWYPFVYLCCSIFPLVNRIQNAVYDQPVYALVVLQVICTPLPGAVNAIVFALDKGTVSKLTWTQIKMAFHGKLRRSDSMINDYPTVTDVNINSVTLSTPQMSQNSTIATYVPQEYDVTLSVPPMSQSSI